MIEKKSKIVLPIWADILIVLKKSFTSMNLEDLYSKSGPSRCVISHYMHLLLERGLVEVDNSNFKEARKDNRKIFYVLTIPGHDCAEYLEKIKDVLGVPLVLNEPEYNPLFDGGAL